MTDRLKKYNLAKDLAIVKDGEMEKEVFHTKLDMQIQNLISPDNIGDEGSVKVFQQLMNKHIYGEDKLKSNSSQHGCRCEIRESWSL